MSTLIPLKKRFFELDNNKEEWSNRLKMIEENLKNSPLQILSDEIAEMEKVCFLFYSNIC